MSNVPKLRFKEFSGEWEKKHIADYVEQLNGYAFKSDDFNDDSTGKPILRGINISEGFIRHSSDIDKFLITSDKKYDKYILKEGDLVIGMDGSKVGKNVAIIGKEDSGSLLIQRVARLRPKENGDILFIYHHINSSRFHSYVDVVNTSSGIPHISSKQINDFKIYFPSKQEQEKVASFLTSVDTKIEQLTKKEQLLQQYKKGVMQKIFNQEIRFKANDGSEFCDWKENKLGDIIDFENGKAHEQNIVENGEYIVVNSKFISSEGSVFKYSDSLICPLAKNDLVMVMSDVPNGKALAKCFLIKEDNKYTLNQRICALHQKSANNQFLYYIVNRNKYYLAFDSGVGQTNLRKDEVLDLTIDLPCIEEQTKIATFLSSIDSKLEQVQKQLNSTKEFKKALLQQMFV